MNPDAGALALASIEVDITPVKVGQAITVLWRGKPVFIRHRTPDEIASAKAVDLGELRDDSARNDALPESASAADENRIRRFLQNLRDHTPQEIAVSNMPQVQVADQRRCSAAP